MAVRKPALKRREPKIYILGNIESVPTLESNKVSDPEVITGATKRNTSIDGLKTW